MNTALRDAQFLTLVAQLQGRKPNTCTREQQLIEVITQLRSAALGSLSDADRLRAIVEADATLADPDYRTALPASQRRHVAADQFDVEREADQAGVQPSEIINQPPVES